MDFVSPHRVLHSSAEKSPSLQSSMHGYDRLTDSISAIILGVGYLTNYTVIVKEKYLYYLIWRAKSKKERGKKRERWKGGDYSQRAKNPCSPEFDSLV